MVRLLFLFIFVLCLAHYLFFLVLSWAQKPVTKHKFFKYDDRVDFVVQCLHRKDASICGHLPEELAGRITNHNMNQTPCTGKSGVAGIDDGLKVVESKTDFESLEEICSRFC